MKLKTAIDRKKKRLKTCEIVENFGQKEVQKLKDKYGYNPYGTTQERHEAQLIDSFDNWCMNYTH